MNSVRQWLCAISMIALLAGPSTTHAQRCPAPEAPCAKQASAPAFARWRVIDSMNNARFRHTATLLPDGRVLVVGGVGLGETQASSVELYDPPSGTWSSKSPLTVSRWGHSASLLFDGRVMIVGGLTGGGIHWFYDPYELEALYDPVRDQWIGGVASSQTYASGQRYFHTATTLASGDVLVAGGVNWNLDWDSSILLYHPGLNTPKAIGELPAGRGLHVATPLFDGRVLLAGGYVDESPTSTTVLLDVASSATFVAPPMAHPRVGHTASLLTDGTVLVAGGGSAETERFDPVAGIWSSAGRLSADRSNHTASLLPDGRLMVIGGATTTQALSLVEIFDPDVNAWQLAGDLNVARASHTATVMRNGRVLVAGGTGADGEALDSVELLDAPVATPAFTVVEYRNTKDFAASPGGHFFYTDDPGELTAVDEGSFGSFMRTGRTFRSGGSKRICRFFGSVSPGPNSHFYTMSDDECGALKALQFTPAPPNVRQWNYEGLRFAADPRQEDPSGPSCAAGTLPVYRGYNNAFSPAGIEHGWDSAHRYSTNHADIEQLVAYFGWRDEGIVFCTQLPGSSKTQTLNSRSGER